MLTKEEWETSELRDPIQIVIDDNQNGVVITSMACGIEGGGSTTSIFSIAETIAMITGKKVCIIDLNLAQPCLDRFFYMNPTKLVVHLDNLYRQVRSEITAGKLRDNMLAHRDIENLYLIAGTRRPYSSDEFHADTIMAIIAALRRIVDYVFVDVSAHFDNPGTVAGLLGADQVLVFSNYNEDGLRFFNTYYSTLFGKDEICKRMSMVGVETVKGKKEKLEVLCEIPVIACIPHVSEFAFGELSESANKKEMKKYAISIEGIVKSLGITEQSTKQDSVERSRKPWHTRLLSSIKG